MNKLEALRQKRNRIICALFGHSKIQTTFFGYFYCSRCGEQVGDALGGCYNASNVVIVGHDCPTCKANYKKLKWKDKIFCPNPFKKEG
jgi:glycosyltransferase A (GT-A) superfamily protein (DUF2064 family)